MLDSGRNIYVTDFHSNSVLVFAPLKPQIATPAPSPASRGGFPAGAGFSRSGAFNVDFGATPQLCEPTTKTTGNIAAIEAIVSLDASMDDPSAIALDKSGKIYVANPGSWYRDYDSITVYAPGTYANAAPIATIGSFGNSDTTQLGNPVAIAVDATGYIYVANSSVQLLMIITEPSPSMRLIAMAISRQKESSVGQTLGCTIQAVWRLIHPAPCTC
jgi:hypothetical protein